MKTISTPAVVLLAVLVAPTPLVAGGNNSTNAATGEWSTTGNSKPDLIGNAMSTATGTVERRDVVTKMGMPPDFPKEIPSALSFKRVGDKTELTVTEYGWESGQMRDLSESGMNECLDKLAQALAKSE